MSFMSNRPLKRPLGNMGFLHVIVMMYMKYIMLVGFETLIWQLGHTEIF